VILLRLGYALAATALVVLLLRAGLPLGALLVVVLGIALRRRAETTFGRPV